RPHLQLEIAPVARVELVAGRQRRVHLGGRPILRARPEIGDRAVGEAQSRRGGPDRAFFALCRAGDPHAEGRIENERQRQNRRDHRPRLAPEHESPPFLLWTGRPGPPFHIEPVAWLFDPIRPLTAPGTREHTLDVQTDGGEVTVKTAPIALGAALLLAAGLIAVPDSAWAQRSGGSFGGRGGRRAVAG